MGAQTSYNYSTPRGVAGGLYDLSPYEMNSRLNGDEEKALLFGMGVVMAQNPGFDVELPQEDSIAENFEGVVINGLTTQQDVDGALKILHNQSVGILRYGNAWVRIGSAAAPEYGKDVYLITAGEEVGFFTDSEDDSSKIAVPARFIGEKDSGNQIAPVKLYHQTPKTEAQTTQANQV